MSLQAFASLVNAFGPIKISRFGDTMHSQVEVFPDGKGFVLYQRADDPKRGLIGRGIRRVELINISHLQFQTFAYNYIRADYPDNHILSIFLKTATMIEDYLPEKGVVSESVNKMNIYVPSVDLAEQITAYLEQAAGL